MAAKRYLFFWLHFTIGYLFPFVYFATKWGITKKATSIVMPVIFLALIAVIKLCSAIPKWIASWRPSFFKGIISAIPIYLLFICLVTFGLTLKYIMEHTINIKDDLFILYFEVVLVVFGSLSVSSVFSALHIKYRELDLMNKGYTLGVIRR